MDTVKNPMSQRLMIYSDGGARGNPGPAAIAFIALNDKGETVKADSRFIGVHTNNQAEYEALLMALKFASDKKTQEIVCHLDSELVAKQLNGQYAVKNNELWLLWRKVQQLKVCFKKSVLLTFHEATPKLRWQTSLSTKL